MQERLQKILSRWGIASRRQAETLIVAGRVRVNGAVAQLGQTADPEQDAIALDERLLTPQNRPDHQYFLLNKPLRVVSSCHDPRGRKTVLEFLPKALQKGAGIHPVGRLDYNSTGAILLTNDGDLTYQLTHPRHQIPKTYRVLVAGHPSAGMIRRWQQGIILSGRRTLPAEVKVIEGGSSPYTELEVILREGRNRQIRRVAESLGHPVKKLHRVAIGPIQLGELDIGQVRPLQTAELKGLRQALQGETSLSS
jgi:23S rRNA pseudouridine2605 synthase